MIVVFFGLGAEILLKGTALGLFSVSGFSFPESYLKPKDELSKEIILARELYLNSETIAD